jgi:hypothetical protein
MNFRRAMNLQYMWNDRKYLINRKKEQLIRKIAWALPHEVVKWAFYRVLANATTGKYENQVVPELTWQDAIDRWEND